MASDLLNSLPVYKRLYNAARFGRGASKVTHADVFVWEMLKAKYLLIHAAHKNRLAFDNYSNRIIERYVEQWKRGIIGWYQEGWDDF